MFVPFEKNHMLRSPIVFALGYLLATFAPESWAAERPQWKWNLPARKPAWEFTSDMPRDTTYSPVPAGNLVLIGCEHNGALLAIDLDSGAERWRFYTGGPIRVPPVADADRIYLPSDDGHLCCLDHAGKLLWKVRGGANDRQLVAHERMTSAWPASARPLLHEGTIYYIAGYWPVDGVFVHAIDAASGKVLWTNGTPQYRPFGTPRIVGETLFVQGHHGSGAYNRKTGAEVVEKTPPPEKAVPTAFPGGRKITVGVSGEIVCTADREPTPKNDAPAAPTKADVAAASAILGAAKIDGGYVLVAGLTDGSLVEGLLRESKLSVVAIDADAGRVDAVRRRLDAAGVFDDHRLNVLVADPASNGLPPYFASLIVSETDAPLSTTLKKCLHPHGGAWLERVGGKVAVSRRDGAPAGADHWTHEFGNPANTLSVHDTLIKAPLGSLWYGGPATPGKYYYHGMNPVSAQAVDGRMILQGPGVLMAYDIYTGRILWEAKLPTIATFNSLGIHSKDDPHPMKSAKAAQGDVVASQRSRPTGFNFVSTSNGIYLAAGTKLIRFNTVDGQRMSEWTMPIDAEKGLCWGSPRAMGNVLVSTAFRPQDLIDGDAGADGNGGEWSGDRMPMAYLFAIDRETGKLLWSRKADWGFLNRGGVAIGSGKVFAIDLLLEGAYAKFKGSGRKSPETPPSLIALDLATGATAWKKPLEWRAKGILYSAERDIVVVPCRNKIRWENGVWLNARKAKAIDALNGNMRGIRGRDGELLWEVDDSPYNDPPFLLGDLLISRSGLSFDLLTGNRAKRTSPVTGEPEQWSFAKAGCNHLIGCDSLVTWRTGFYDLSGGTGTMALKGMEAGCTPTLIPSGGVLNIPNFGQYHLRARMAAMALVHVPDNPFWAAATGQNDKPTPAPIAKAGFHFGAPGARKADDGVLWLPVNAKVNNGVAVKGDKLDWFQLHPGQTGDWIGATGVVGATDIAIPLTFGGKNVKDAGKRRYDVRLHFIEPQPAKAGERVFSVRLEGQPAVTDIDIAKEAGTLRRVTREIANVEVDGPLNIQMSASSGRPILVGVELIAR